MSRRSLAVLAVLAVVVAGCGTPGDDSDDTIPPVTPVPTVGGVGQVPVAPSAVREPIVVVLPPVDADGNEAQLIAEVADGNRILMIGDSILASTSSRYGGQMCDALLPLGWKVAVEAEPSRFIDFGNRVLDKMLLDDAAPEEDWNAALVFLGSNYGGDQARYEAELVRILDRLAPRPTLLLTVTEYRPDYVEVNEVVNRLGAERDNVTVLDWKTISETPGVLSSDRLHPTDAGRRVLAESVAAALGQFFGVGECLRSTFRDDSRVGGNTITVLGQPSTGSGSSSATTSTTVRPTTSAPGVNPSSTVPTPASTAAPSTTRPPTSPTTTAAPATTAPSTTPPPTSPTTTAAPETTAAPTTAAPTTAAPTTTAPAESGLAEPGP